jgi:hypothetical protein
MAIDYHERPAASDSNSRPAYGSSRSSPRLRGTAAIILLSGAMISCVIPMDTGANAAAIALEEVDNALYTMRDESALLQAQIDSLSAALRKTDSLVRWVANLTGNPIIDPPVFYIPPP